MHMMGFTTWQQADVTAHDMRTWKFAGSRIYVSFPADADRETLLAHVASALTEIDLTACGAAD